VKSCLKDFNTFSMLHHVIEESNGFLRFLKTLSFFNDLFLNSFGLWFFDVLDRLFNRCDDGR